MCYSQNLDLGIIPNCATFWPESLILPALAHSNLLSDKFWVSTSYVSSIFSISTLPMFLSLPIYYFNHILVKTLNLFFFQSFYYSCLPKSNIGPVRLSTTSRILYRFVNTTEEKDSTMRYISVTVYFCYSSCAQLPPSLLSILLGFPKFPTHHLPTP